MPTIVKMRVNIKGLHINTNALNMSYVFGIWYSREIFQSNINVQKSYCIKTQAAVTLSIIGMANSY